MPRSKSDSANSSSSNGRITVRNIAEAAGVSIGSVSTVLNNYHLERRISEATAKKIREVAAKMGYLPNIGARRLRSISKGRSPVVLALVTSYEAPISLVHYFLNAIRRAVRDGKTRRKYTFSVVIEMFNAGKLSELQGFLTGEHFNAAIILNTAAEDDRFLRRNRLSYPVVLVNRSIPGYPSVMEDLSGGRRAAEILLEGGSRNLAVIHGSPFTQITRMRVESFVKHAEKLLGKRPVEIVADRLSEQAAYDAMTALIDRGVSIDGLYAVSDALALGAYSAIKEKGISIPRDMSVIGVGDYDISAFFDPPLSCVGVSHLKLAEQAASALLAQLDFHDEDSKLVQMVALTEVIRASTR